MKSNNSQSEGTAAQELQRRVSERFGVLPNFFRLSPETPEITEKLGICASSVSRQPPTVCL